MAPTCSPAAHAASIKRLGLHDALSSAREPAGDNEELPVAHAVLWYFLPQTYERMLLIMMYIIKFRALAISFNQGAPASAAAGCCRPPPGC